MDLKTIWQWRCSGRLRRFWRRAVAMILALSCLLPANAFAAGASSLLQPTQASDIEFPQIEVQGNLVRNEFGFLTGYFELALRVQTPKIPSAIPDADPVYRTFRALSLSLQYDTSVLTPVGWSWVPTDPTLPFVDQMDPNVPVVTNSYYQTQLPTQKYDATSSAVAQTGIVQGATGSLTTEVLNGDQSLLFFRAETYKEVSFPKMTTLAVIRFYVNPDEMEKFSITKNTTNTVDTYDLSYNGSIVGDMAELATAMTPAGEAVIKPIVSFADDDDIKISKSPTRYALYYRSGDNEFYYVPKYDSMNSDTITQVSFEADGQTWSIDAPVTENLRVLAAKDGGDPATDTDYYSYITNLLPEAKLTFPVVSQTSFVDSGSNIGNLTTLVYVDWDNTIIGTQIVPKNTDVRGLVSDFVADKFIYPDLNTPTPAQVASLSRADSYRGKYPTTPMVPGNTDGSDVQDGEKYPLTNKLDYTFFKRPMVHDTPMPDATDTTKYPSGSEDPDYIKDMAEWNKSGWIQKTTTAVDGTATPEYEADYPFAYGWAKCTADTYMDTWTTLASTGELNNYTVDADGTASVAYAGDGIFTFADLETGFTANESEIFLKAIYEPGEKLLNTAFNYRLVKQPYYNKLNYLASSAGGAFSVSVEMERASDKMDGTLRGVPRMREPVVRQHVTTDLRWEQNDELGVNHDLPNPKLEEAATTRTKTTYIKVDIQNSDLIAIELALSARQNKVDYFLVDKYDNNFVSGGERSSSNFSYTDPADFTVDNYNYYVDGESDSTDAYYDVPVFANKDGSLGFVLFGTLNSLMEKASQYNAGEITQNTFNQYVSSSTLADANLRDASGNLADISNQAALRTALLNAATAAKAAHDGGNNQYWNIARNCAQLTYHQLQGFILDGSLAHGEDPIPALTWCHLHAACAAASSGKPTTWAELMLAAATPADQANIDLLTTGEVESLFHLRNDGGTLWSTTNAFKTELIAAVAALTAIQGDAPEDLTWDQVQHYLDKNTADVDGGGIISPSDLTAANMYGKENYWWYDGGVKPTNFASVLTAANTANTIDRPAALNTLRAAYETMAAASDSSDTLAYLNWIALTENLATADGVPFASFDDFKAAVQAAVAACGTGVTWGEIQYYIIHNAVASGGAAEPEIAGYWWHNGGQKITNIKTMLTAAKEKSASWASFTLAEMQSNSELSLRADFAGAPWQNEVDFKTAIETIADNNLNTISWNQVQYLLIHDSMVTVSTFDADTEGDAYYWWKGGNTTPPTMTHNTSTVQHAVPSAAKAYSLGVAAFRIAKNGIPEVNSGLTDAILKAYRLQKAIPEATDLTYEVQLFETADIAIMMTNLIALVDNARAAGNGTEFTPPDLSWFQVQYGLLNSGAYLEAGLPTDDDYWWRMKDGNPNAAGAKTEFEKLLENMYAFANGDLSDTDFNATITVNSLQDSSMDLRRTATTYYTTDALVKNGPQKFLRTLAQSAYAANYVDHTNQKLTLSWTQVQYGVMQVNKGALVTQDIADGAGYTWDPTVTAVNLSLMTLEFEEGELRAKMADITLQIINLTSQLKENPEQLDELLTQLDELKKAYEELIAVIERLQKSAEEIIPSSVPEESQAPTESPEISESPAPEESQAPTESPETSESPAPEESQAPTESPETSESPAPEESRAPTESPEASESPDPEESQVPTEGPEASESPAPEESQAPAENPEAPGTPGPEESRPLDTEESGDPAPEGSGEPVPEPSAPSKEDAGEGGMTLLRLPTWRKQFLYAGVRYKVPVSDTGQRYGPTRDGPVVSTARPPSQTHTVGLGAVRRIYK
ncbi:hypothetical protein AAEU42_03185 [Pseudoflavonifractor phocaeensis]|uniref:hypothetical protein n=1 Tax=Pseudoflavonifractor phocaeensis TaxID=1870988 RepID=UPI00313EC7D1